MGTPDGTIRRVAFFGHFDASNFGNESSLQAILHHLHRFHPEAQATCICTGPAATAAAYQVEAIPISDTFARDWAPRTKAGRLLRKLCIGLISEPHQWLRGFLRMRRTDMLIVPGTGLLTDAYGLLSWGPYNLFKWSVLARLGGCRLAFVSIGAGPVYTALGRYFVRTMLNIADFRSYREESSVAFVRTLGVAADESQLYPDLAFSLPEHAIPRDAAPAAARRPVVGLGVMEYAGRYSTPDGGDAIYANYLESLAQFVAWLLQRGYDIRLLSGDLSDMQARLALLALLRGRLPAEQLARVTNEPVFSVADVLAQIAASDIIVATRFHNLLLSFLCTKPVISISFHHKCDSLMQAMRMSEYCLGIGALTSAGLIDTFCAIEQQAERLKPVIRDRVRRFRLVLDRQYTLIFGDTRRRSSSAAPDETEAGVGPMLPRVEAGH